MALTIQSKSKRTQTRLLTGLAELESDGYYRYGDNLSAFEIRARVILLANTTLESFEWHKATWEKTSVVQRFIPLYYRVPEETLKKLAKDEKRLLLDIPKGLAVESEVVLTEEDKTRILEMAERWAILVLSTSLLDTYEKIEALLCGHANLNFRNHLCEDDWKFLGYISNLLIGNNIRKRDLQIWKLRRQGMTYDEIRAELPRYGLKAVSKKTIGKVVKRYEARFGYSLGELTEEDLER